MTVRQVAGMSEQQSAAELIAALKADAGMSNREIGAVLGRDPSLVSQVARGKKPGSNLVAPLAELYRTGTVTQGPPRRRTKSGAPAMVRGAKGEPGRAPSEVDARYRQMPKRGTYRPEQTHYLRNGGRVYETHFPKSERAKGRPQGWKRVHRQLKSAARRTYGAKKRPPMRVTFDVTYANGRQMRVGERGGYDVQAVTRAVSEHGGDFEAWVKSQGGTRYASLDTSQNAVTGVQMVVMPWNKRAE